MVDEAEFFWDWGNTVPTGHRDVVRAPCSPARVCNQHHTGAIHGAFDRTYTSPSQPDGRNDLPLSQTCRKNVKGKASRSARSAPRTVLGRAATDKPPRSVLHSRSVALDLSVSVLHPLQAPDVLPTTRLDQDARWTCLGNGRREITPQPREL